jgi:GT2 family glycosyltransferase
MKPASSLILDPVATGYRGNGRPRVRGKFLAAGGEKLYVRGVTYGTFRPRNGGCEFPERQVVERDFAQMVAAGANAVRTYTVPPPWLLDAASNAGLHVMVGVPAERYIGYLIDKDDAPDIPGLVRQAVRSTAGHPAILCYAVGNEIPAPVARWHGPARVVRYIERLCQAVKAEDPEALVTYVNYPSTEYLELPFLDLVCFNVFLESRQNYEGYLARLQNLAGERPLLVTEIGLDSFRNGEDRQARTLDWQIRSSFTAGCAGAFVYAWTDEWHRSGEDVLDWEFGLTRRDRRPKPALTAVREAFADVPFEPGLAWPRFSVVVCTYNGAATIRECLEGLERLDYPDYEVIVVDDGSTDGVGEIAAEFDCRLISTENRGLSNARNTGLAAADGELVAYLDDDAYPDPQWLRYLAQTFMTTDHVGVGGPNISPPGDGALAECVANAPGNPIHVLLTDEQAEHIPGCNMAFRKSSLEAVGGFDPRFRVAGDDIDICWKLEQAGGSLGYCAAAMVWHHRRGSLRAFWRQQTGYGEAEALLARKWPGKYGAGGQIRWGGRLYGRGLTEALVWRQNRMYHGVWGMAPYQSLYEPAPGRLGWLALMPEWYLLIGGLSVISLLGLDWAPLRLALLPLGFLVLFTLIQAARNGAKADFRNVSAGRLSTLRLRAITAGLHIMQPLARLVSRLGAGLTPWRRFDLSGIGLPRTSTHAIWSEQWQSARDRLTQMKDGLQRAGAYVRSGGNFDPWDLEVRGGMLGAVRVVTAVEEHGGGQQLVRVRTSPSPSMLGAAGSLLLAPLSALALADGALVAGLVLGASAVLVTLRTLRDMAVAAAAVRDLLDEGTAQPG